MSVALALGAALKLGPRAGGGCGNGVRPPLFGRNGVAVATESACGIGGTLIGVTEGLGAGSWVGRRGAILSEAVAPGVAIPNGVERVPGRRGSWNGGVGVLAEGGINAAVGETEGCTRAGSTVTEGAVVAVPAPSVS